MERRKSLLKIVEEVIGEKGDSGWEAYMSGVKKAFCWFRVFSDDEKTSVEKALFEAGYKESEVQVSRIGEGSLMSKTDLGGNRTFVYLYR